MRTSLMLHMLQPGTRVVHTPTGETGVVNRIEVLWRSDKLSKLTMLHVVVIKPDRPVWMREIWYWQGSLPGRKINDLKILREAESGQTLQRSATT